MAKMIAGGKFTQGHMPNGILISYACVADRLSYFDIRDGVLAVSHSLGAEGGGSGSVGTRRGCGCGPSGGIENDHISSKMGT
jgi:hypothetical protein